MTDTVLAIQDLKVWLQSESGYVKAVDTVNLEVKRGQTLGLVGESGCGKSMLALSLLRLLPLNAKVDLRTKVMLEGQDLYALNEKQMQVIRRQKIAMIFQDPMLALNPVMTVGQQIMESGVSEKRGLSLLTEVRVPDPKRLWAAYPHQLSGGMKQRILIAMAIAKEPVLLIADEPTTALDVTIQAQVLHLLQSLQAKYGMAMIFISHNLGVIRQIAHDVAIMYAGHVVEQQSIQQFIHNPLHPYCQQLIQAVPEKTERYQPLQGIAGQVPSLTQKWMGCRYQNRCYAKWSLCETVAPELIKINDQISVRCHWHDAKQVKPQSQLPTLSPLVAPKVYEHLPNIEPLLSVKGLKVYFPIQKGILRRTVGHVKAVDSVSFDLYRDQTIAIVGESGCGKTSLGKALLQLIRPTSGEVHYLGRDLCSMSARQLRQGRSHFQFIFQDPYASLDPRMRVEESLLEGMRALNIGSDKAEWQDRLRLLMEQVGLPEIGLSRYPHEFSGGQRQRLCIARALAVGPKWIVCDEPTSALDVSVQAQILNLLQQLQDDYSLSYLFITHDLGVVRHMADKVMVMYLGKVVEQGTVSEILDSPLHPYTQTLIEAIPSVFRTTPLALSKGETPSPANPPPGCTYHLRCAHAMPICSQQAPALIHQQQRQVACHLFAESHV